MSAPTGPVHKLGPYTLSEDLLRSVHKAAKRTGISFPFMLAKAGKESAFNPELKARTSSATGLYQFTKQTWFEQIHRHGADYGVAHLAKAVVPDGGRYDVPDRDMKAHILNLRKDPALSAAMAAEYAARGGRMVAEHLGRAPTDEELYFAHFMGPTGAVDMLRAADQTPDRRADHIAPQAARANRTLFYDQIDGHALTAREMVDQLAGKFAIHLENARLLDEQLSYNDYADLYGGPPPYPMARMAQGAAAFDPQTLAALVQISDIGLPQMAFSAMTGSAGDQSGPSPFAEASRMADAYGKAMRGHAQSGMAAMPGVEAVSAQSTGLPSGDESIDVSGHDAGGEGTLATLFRTFMAPRRD